MAVSSEQFYQAFRERFPTKQTLVLAKIEEIKAFLLNFNQSQENEPTKKSKLEKMTHNNWLSRYYLKEIGETFYVFYASNNRRMVSFEELFDLIHQAHTKTEHGGRTIMENQLQGYSPVPREALQIYLSLCESCELKRARVKKGLVVKPILSFEMNSRCQIDLIDMQAQEFEGFRFVMVYQDHLTKYVLLRPIKSKTAEAVAEELMRIFADFGAPRILHTDNGREFANSIVKHIVAEWPDCKLVHGKPRHSQSQGSVERANRDIEDMIATWCTDKKSKNWPKALIFIQVSKNRRLHSGIGRTPYQAMFGRLMTMGISDDGLTPEELERIQSEEDLEAVFNSQKRARDFEENNNIEKGLEQIAGPSILSNYLENDLKAAVVEENDEELTDYSLLVERLIQKEREGARLAQKKQAKKMLESSNKRFQPVLPGSSVVIPVPSFDRAKGDFRNVMGTVMTEEGGFYQIGTSQGILPQMFTRNQFEPTATNFLSPDQVPDKKTTLRTTAIGASPIGGQGFFHCNCLTGCENDRCKCRRNKRVCNSKCHGSKSCKNSDNQ